MNGNEALRPLRLWHFQQMTAARERAQVCPSTTECMKQNTLADKHLTFVQVLNEFFMVSDTAEADAARLRPKT